MTKYTRVVRKVMHRSSPISYWIEGNTKHAPLVLLPGFTGTHGDLLDFARYLKDDLFLIMPEFPGWGESPQGDSKLTIHDYAEVVKHMLDELKIEKAAIVGHCMGAAVAIECAALFPERVEQVILISPSYQHGTVGQLLFKVLGVWSEKSPAFFRPLFFFWRSRILTIPLSFFVLQTRKFSRKLHIVEKTLTVQSHQNEHVLETNWNSLIRYDYTKARSITVPVHILHGAKDMLIPPLQAEKLSKLFHHATLDLLPHAGHVPPVETPGSVARLVKKYLM